MFSTDNDRARGRADRRTQQGAPRAPWRFVVMLLPAALASVVLCGFIDAAEQRVQRLSTEVLAAVFEGNLSAISNVRYTMNYAYELTPEGEAYMRRAKDHKDSKPVLTETERKEQFEITVTATREKSRVETKRYSAGGDNLKLHKLEVWNGERLKTYSVLEQTGYVGQDPPRMDGMRPENLGMYVAGIPIYDYIRNNTASLDGNTLTVSGSNRQTVVAYLNPSQYYWPTRIECFQNGRLRMRYSDIKVEKFHVQGQTIYFPVSGKVESFRSKEGDSASESSEPVLLTSGNITA